MAAQGATSLADKQARQRKIAVAGGVLLAGLLAIQVPRTMKMLDGGQSAPVPAVEAVGEAPAAQGSEAAAPASPGTSSLDALVSSDPVPAAGPEKLNSFGRFEPRDPFVQRLEPGASAAPSTDGEATTAPEAPGTPGETAAPTRGGWPGGAAYTIVLASVPVEAGRKAADQLAAEMRKRGLPAVGVLVSADYSSLRPGYFVVFSGVYKTAAGAHKVLPKARAKADPTAYPRHIAP